MGFKNYKVYFSRTAMGEEGAPITDLFKAGLDEYGPHWPIETLGGESFQMRDIERTGRVWRGTFVKLRDDAPHIVSAKNRERELELEVGDRIIEKCHFIYRELRNILIWQTNRTAGGLSRAQEYLSAIAESTFVALPQVMNAAELERVLAGQIYELDFAYDRPVQLQNDAPKWNQNAFDMMSKVDAAHAKFTLRAPRKGGLAETAKAMVRQLIPAIGIEKIRVRLTDESEPIELFMAPLKDTIRVELVGRYPAAKAVYEGLEEAFVRQSAFIPDQPNAKSVALHVKDAPLTAKTAQLHVVEI